MSELMKEASKAFNLNNNKPQSSMSGSHSNPAEAARKAMDPDGK